MMPRATILIALTLLTLACFHRQTGGESAGKVGDTGTAPAGSASSPPAPAANPSPSPTGTPGAPPKPVDFATQIRPILEEKCTPCHFPGGRMYERLPFDKEATIRILGSAMYSRLKDPLDVELLRSFLGEPE